MHINQHITVNTSNTLSNCGTLALASSFIHGHIAAITDKAVKVENENGFCWFPKKALTKQRDLGGDLLCNTAKWFTLSHWHHRLETTSVLAG